MQWFVNKCDKESDKALEQEENYVFPKKYHNYKDIIRDYIGEIKRLDEFLFKGTEKLLPKKKDDKSKAKVKEKKVNQPLDVHKYVGQLWKSVKTVNKIPTYNLKPEMLRQLIIRTATVKPKDLAAMVIEHKESVNK